MHIEYRNMLSCPSLNPLYLLNKLSPSAMLAIFLTTNATLLFAFVQNDIMYAVAVPVSEESLTACIMLTSMLLAGSAWMSIHDIKGEEEEKDGN